MAISILLCSCDRMGQKQIYSCENRVDMNSCSSLCKATEEAIKIKTDKATKVVQVVNYLKSEQGRTYILENCKVIDDSNWECNNSAEHRVIKSTEIEKMAEGKYAHFHQLEFRDSEMSEWRPQSALMLCSK